MSCDKVGNLLLAKFSAQGASDVAIHIPASIVFFLLQNMPVNQDPALAPPPAAPQIGPEDWRNPNLPRASTVRVSWRSSATSPCRCSRRPSSSS